MRKTASRSRLERILGVDISVGDIDEVCDLCVGWVETAAAARYVICINPHSFECCRRLPEFAQAVADAALVIPDGVGVVIASRLRGGRVRQRVCGPDVFVRLSAQMNDSALNRKVFFLGGDPALLAAIEKRYRQEFPNLSVAGVFAPRFCATFDGDANEEMIAKINASAPDVVWVGLGSPKQELWVWRNVHRLNTRLVMPIGAAFDFYGGRKREAPAWVKKAGLQWLHRLLAEPRRLWRRNLDAPIFLLRAVTERRAGPP